MEITGEQILPTPLRVGADERFTGRGVTIAFLDSGFYPHPDLTQPESRIVRYTSPDPYLATEEAFHTPDVSSWHGTMTSVVACGNGYLSGGYYRGIASDARVVLIRVRVGDGNDHADIRRGLEWVLEHHQECGIRIVNISCAGDYEASYLTDDLSQRAEDVVRAGLVVVCAAGNSGDSEDHAVLPPASCPAVITVGGVNDQNTLRLADDEMYNSSYGPTIDGLQKPEVIAPSMLLAAPILPETSTAAEAELLARLKVTPDSQLAALLKKNRGVSAELDQVSHQSPSQIRQAVEARISDENIISRSYKHVDGTSFAAPIVSSIVAQMLEASPALKPHQVKRILIETAERLPDVSTDQQGWGAVIAGRAVGRALQLAGRH
ncbi:MAG: S8 family serine peptidase [Blastocatellia bacterium]